MRIKLITLSIVFLIFIKLSAQSTKLTVQVDKPIAEIQPTMWGIFFEDINFGADGGLYAELVKNRSFEFANPLMGWKQEKSDRFSVNKESGQALILNRGDENISNPRFARIDDTGEGYGLTNEGFRGMGIKKDMQYNFSMLARQNEGSTKIRIDLKDGKGTLLGTATISPSGKDWKEYTATFKATGTE